MSTMDLYDLEISKGFKSCNNSIICELILTVNMKTPSYLLSSLQKMISELLAF